MALGKQRFGYFNLKLGRALLSLGPRAVAFVVGSTTPIPITGLKAGETVASVTGPFTVSGNSIVPSGSITAGTYSPVVTTSTGRTLTITATVSAASLTATTTSLSPSNANPPSGTPISLTATIAPSAATGTVTFKDGSTTIGTAPVSSGAATISNVNLSVGTHSITAVYGGDTTYATSTSAISIVTVSAASGSTRADSTTITADSTAYTMDKAA